MKKTPQDLGSALSFHGVPGVLFLGFPGVCHGVFPVSAMAFFPAPFFPASPPPELEFHLFPRKQNHFYRHFISEVSRFSPFFFRRRTRKENYWKEIKLSYVSVVRLFGSFFYIFPFHFLFSSFFKFAVIEFQWGLRPKFNLLERS